MAAFGLLASAGWAQDELVSPAAGVSTGEPALDALFTIGLGLLVIIVVVMIGHSYWAYQRARRHPLQDSEDAVRNLDK